MFYRINNDYRSLLELLEEVHPESYGFVEDFVDDLIAEGISKHKIYSYIKSLKVVDKKINM